MSNEQKPSNKGKQGQRDIISDFNTRFPACEFKLGKYGSIVQPKNFQFLIQAKVGYSEIDLFNCFPGRCTALDQFLKNIAELCVESKLKPLLIWKKDRKDKVAFVQDRELVEEFLSGSPLPVATLYYTGWIGVSLSWLLNLPDSFFFTSNQK